MTPFLVELRELCAIGSASSAEHGKKWMVLSVHFCALLAFDEDMEKATNEAKVVQALGRMGVADLEWRFLSRDVGEDRPLCSWKAGSWGFAAPHKGDMRRYECREDGVVAEGRLLGDLVENLARNLGARILAGVSESSLSWGRERIVSELRKERARIERVDLESQVGQAPGSSGAKRRM